MNSRQADTVCFLLVFVKIHTCELINTYVCGQISITPCAQIFILLFSTYSAIITISSVIEYYLETRFFFYLNGYICSIID